MGKKRRKNEPEELSRWPPPSTSTGQAVYSLLYGVKGYGKTYFARRVFWARRRKKGSGIFFDPKAENEGMGVVVATVEELREVIGKARRAGEPFSVVVCLGWNESAEEFWPVIFQTGNLLLILDEAQDYAGRNVSEKSGIIQIIGKGRSRRIDILSTVRTPPEIHKQLRGNWDVVVTFRQGERDYADHLARRYFPGPGMTEKILNLPLYRYLHSHHGRVTEGIIPPPT